MRLSSAGREQSWTWTKGATGKSRVSGEELLGRDPRGCRGRLTICGHLRVIAASRKKTDKRDAYWLARAVQTGMTPHPV